MLTCTITVLDEVNCQIGGLHPEHLESLWNTFGIFAEGYRHMPAFQLRRWDGKIRFFDKNGRTHTKILDEILPYLGSWGYDINLVDKRLPAPVITQQIEEGFFNLDHFKLRPYQVEVVNALLAEGSGFAICATGSGKTSMCAALAMAMYAHGLQTLVIVPSRDLVTQTVAEFRDRLQAYDVSIGEYSGESKNIDHPIVVGTWQSLQNATHYMQYFQAVIVDEAHGVKANVVRDLINTHGKHISHRYGCTGTFPKAEVDKYSLVTSIGRIVRQVPAKWLIEQGYLSEIQILPVETMDADPKLPDYAAERAFITGMDDRTGGIAKFIEELRLEYGNTLVLVNTSALPQGRQLSAMIPDSVYLDGGSASAVREANYQQFDTRDDVVVIASAGIASTGISIDRIFCLVLLDTGKSFVKCIQSVGRGLRRKGDKNKIFVVDIYAKMKYAKKHFKDRKEYYQEAEYPLLQTHKLKY